MKNESPDQTLPPNSDPCIRRVPRGRGIEAQKVQQRLQGFEPNNCEAWRAIQYQFRSGITHHELRSVAQVICLKTGLTLDRDAYRDRAVLIKWFSDNWIQVAPILGCMNLRDSFNREITLVREITEMT
jgi:hypothetical protein